ncbi:polyribonucleotide nucleotidyltransferase [Neptunomonas sp.]|uniref:polyribonucleotide nucleotidyltransferase n=1 Tax=Neptunomonas sp. TaxID=1971898 RepID=UPI0035662D49
MKSISAILIFCFITSIAGCGTIIHPERKGQINGRLDSSIVLLDAIGLLFFFVPGVIAFAVDFSNGTIYLPGGRRASLSLEELDAISSNGKIDRQALDSIVQKQAGSSILLNGEDLQAIHLSSIDQLPRDLVANR